MKSRERLLVQAKIGDTWLNTYVDLDLAAAHYMTVVAPLYYKEVHKKYPKLPRFAGEKPWIRA